MEDGIAIRMRSMKSVSISPDGDTATLGGGVLSKEVIDGLWTAGKQTGMLGHVSQILSRRKYNH